MSDKLTKDDFKGINMMAKIAMFWLVLDLVLLGLGG